MKKVISLFVFMALAVSMLIPCFAISYYDVDMDSLKEIYSVKKDEKVLDIIYSNPIILILMEKDNKSIIKTSNNYGETWEEFNLTDKYDGFKANGMFKDICIWGGVHIYGTRKGKLAILHSSTLEGWENILCDISKYDGEIANMTSSYIGYKIYAVNGNKKVLIDTQSFSHDLKITNIEYIPENIFSNNNIFISYTRNGVEISLDGINFKQINIRGATSIEKCEIYDSDCSSTFITVVYKAKSGTARNVLINLYVENGEIQYELKKDSLVTDRYDMDEQGAWAYPIVVYMDNKVYSGFIKEDSKTSSCSMNDIGWIYSYGVPDEWAFAKVADMASKGILTPWTLQEDYKEAVTRKNFCKYIYNLIVDKIDESKMSKTLKFNDCDDKKIDTIANLGIINGIGNGKFEPDRGITREEAITVIGRVATFLGLNKSTTGMVKEFTDIKDVAIWAKEDVKNMQFLGIVTGDNLGNFNPKNDLSVQESLVIISRIYDLLHPKECAVCS